VKKTAAKKTTKKAKDLSVTPKQAKKVKGGSLNFTRSKLGDGSV